MKRPVFVPPDARNVNLNFLVELAGTDPAATTSEPTVIVKLPVTAESFLTVMLRISPGLNVRTP